ncbi:MAG TPA: FIST N-terminal domain-containing protein [Thermomicrobiales bacterium]|jgi:small ligand-binding sensory domain FIST
MDIDSPGARAAVAADGDWETAVQRALNETRGVRPDAVVLFAASEYAAHFPEMVRRVWRETGAPVLVGCSGIGVIGPGRELERVPALAVLQLALPGGALRGVRFTQRMVETCRDAEAWHRGLGVGSGEVDGWLVFADPFNLDAEALIAGLGEAYPGAPILGGLASPGPLDRRTWVFLNGEAYADGGVGLGIGGDYGLVPLVSQGCEPIGEAWTITGVQDHWIETISNRPAVDVLVETLSALPEELQPPAQQNLVVGIAADEYRHEFVRGDFLVRNLIGLDRGSGAIAIGALPRLGQTIQFQVRDAATADLDLTLMLDDLRPRLAGRRPLAAVLNSCNGRGVGLFGSSHHDATAIDRKLGPLPLAGLFCAGEIGPVGTTSYLHGFTASLGLIVRND